VLLVRNHSVVPHVKVAQSTDDIDWKNVELRVFSIDNADAAGLFATPEGGVHTLRLAAPSGTFALRADPLRGQVRWEVTRFLPKGF
jgi:alpha-D-xyloside xylohydrolase